VTTKEAFKIAVEAIEEKFSDTVKRWGYTVVRKGDGNWVGWEIAELSPYEIVSATKFDAYVRLWRPTNQVCRIFPDRFSPDELKHAAKLFVSRALEKMALILAHRELRNLRGVDDIWRNNSALKVRVNSEAFLLKFGLGKKFWNWKVVSDEGATLAIIRRPLSDNPVEGLIEAAKYFSLLAL
jgi:hypothetical protein